MKKRKYIKRLLSFILGIVILIQSFFNYEFPSFAAYPATASDSLEAYTYDSEMEIEELDDDIYDDAGIKMVPLSPDAIYLLEHGNPDDELNQLTDEDIANIPAPMWVVADDLVLFIGSILLVSLFGVSIKACNNLIDYFKTYGYAGHSKVFNDVKYEFIDSSGHVVSNTITQKMIESTADKISVLENDTTLNPVIGLTDNDKLVLTYITGRQIGFTEIRRENIRVKATNTELVKKYPYYIMVSSDNNVYQYCFDKKPIGSFASGNSTFAYDMNGEGIYFRKNDVIFYSDYAIEYNNGVAKLCLDICNLCVYNYKLNNTSGIIENTGYYTEWKPTTKTVADKEYLEYINPSFETGSCNFPFSLFFSNATDNISLKLIDCISVSPDLKIGTSSARFKVYNSPRVTNAGVYYDSLPDIVDTKEGINIDDPANLYGLTTYLNPTGVATWTGAIDPPKPTESESVKPGESVKPSEGTGESSGTGDAGTVSISLTTIITKLGSLFDWISTNLSPLAIANAIAAALGLSALFQTVTLPLNDILSRVGVLSSIATGIDKIAHWDIESWIGTMSAPLSRLMDIDSTLDDILNWDIDVSVGGMTSALKEIAIDIQNTASKITSWTFADWTNVISESLKDVISVPLSGLRAGTDTLVGTLGKVSAWDLDKSIDSLKEALLTALKGTLAIGGIAALIELLTSIKDSVQTIAIGGEGGTEKDDKTDSSLLSAIKLLYLLLALIILLIIIFINCLRFIVAIFSIPASTVLLNDDILKGINFVKGLQIEQFHLSLYDLILVVTHFLLFMAIIKSLRHKIDSFHL